MAARRKSEADKPPIRRPDKNRSRVTTLIVTSDPIIRRALGSMLEEQSGWIVRQTGNYGAAVQQAIAMPPNIVIVDINTAHLETAQSIRAILNAIPDIPVLALSATTSEQVIHAALDAGVLGFLLKGDAEKELIPALKTLLQGRTFFDANVFKRIRDLWYPPSGNRSPLTQRELQVLKLLAEGKKNRETSATLGISVRTVEDIRARIMQKLSLKTLSDLVRYAVRNGIAAP